MEVVVLLKIHLVEYESGRTNQKALIKHVLCKCRCEVDGKKCKSKQKWNNNKYQCESKNSNISTYAWKPSMCACSEMKIVRLVNI